MSGVAENSSKPKSSRSPSFPYISLPAAVERTRALAHENKRFDVLLSDVAPIWNMKATSSSLLRTAAALIAFGLVDDSGSGEARKIRVSDLGWRILHDDRPGNRDKALAESAIKPKLIADCFEKWGYDSGGRPGDKAAVSYLKVDLRFPEEAAEHFLRVYDETISYAGLNRGSAKESEATPALEASSVQSESSLQLHGRPFQLEDRDANPPAPALRPTLTTGINEALADNEFREFLYGPLSRSVSFRLKVRGTVGPKELGKLIKLLEIQKSILEDEDDPALTANEEGSD